MTQTVTQAAEEAGTVAASGGRTTARGAGGVADRNLTADGLLNPLAAVDGLFVRDADANRAGRLAGNLTGFVRGALLNDVLLNAGVSANLDLLFFPRVLANRNLAGDGFIHADLLADGHGAFAIFRAANPDFASAGRTASVASVGGAAAGIAAAATMSAEESAAAAQTAEQGSHFFALPVAQADELLLRAGFLHGFVARLVDHAIFPHGRLAANLAGLFGPDRNFLGHANHAILDNANAFATNRVIGFRTAFHAIDDSLDGDILFHPFRTCHGAESGSRRASRRRATGVTTTGRPKIRACGRNRHGGNGANQQSQTKTLAYHAFSLVIHADPVIPYGNARLVRIDTGDKTHH